MYKLDLTEEEQELLEEALDDAITVAEGVIEMHIESDQTPETVEEFMEVVSTAQERLIRLVELHTKVTEG